MRREEEMKCLIDDHLHCCPHGYTCDTEKGQCYQEISIPWFRKTPSIRREHRSLSNVVLLKAKKSCVV